MGTYPKDNPVSIAFNGYLITLDFERLGQGVKDIEERFNVLKLMILHKYRELYQHIADETIRTLAIIRKYNPSRGAKRTKDADTEKINPLNGIIQWLKVDDPFPEINSYIPILLYKAEGGTIIWRDHKIPVEGDILYCFRLLCQCFEVFNCKSHLADKLFYLFIMNTLYGIGTLTTTGENFRRSYEMKEN